MALRTLASWCFPVTICVIRGTSPGDPEFWLEQIRCRLLVDCAYLRYFPVSVSEGVELEEIATELQAGWETP